MLMSIKNVHKRFGNIKVLRGVDMDIEKGDVVVILGPSGSGKTTFLRCLNFLERADEGTMVLDDLSLDLHNASKKDVALVRKRRLLSSRDTIFLPIKRFYKMLH